jgi:indolepyruvate ferredoxin oxidoreductase
VSDRPADDRYALERGRVLLTGVQALVRLPLDQHRADRRRGLCTATMISGYPGSPLGGVDRELGRNRAICEEHHVHHVPGVNEELAATAAWGSQLATQLPGARYDGVVGIWYGKAPGLDRATDALRHGNFAGVSRTGGGLVAVGDDPGSRSSPLPSASESLLANLHIPVFFPGSVQETLDLGLHALACSRASGLWCALKMVTDVADAVATVEVAPDRVTPSLPVLEWEGGPYEHIPDATLLAPSSLEMERTLLGPRTELAHAYVREQRIDRVEGAGDGAWLGMVAAGKSYRDLRQALRDLGLDGAALERVGVRILKLGLIWPLERRIAAEFAAGLEEVLVIEEKRPFLEAQLKDVLYGLPDAPRILGKRDEHGEPLLPAEADLDVDAVARAVAQRLGRRARIDSVAARIALLDEIAARPPAEAQPSRTPFFCSGCPHSSSTRAPEGTLVGAGVGCHTLVLLNPEGRGQLTGLTQMGGEGAQWIGISPFVDRDHLVQNLGDGTFHHSGSLAVRAAVAAGVNVTFKLLCNGVVAMTGGQSVDGGMNVPDLTRALAAEGVRRIVVTAEDPSRYEGVELAPIAELRGREDLISAQRDLARVEGVTVLIHDQECAIEKRRRRRGGAEPPPAERVWVNERVCEGCGDCGRKSGCLSVMPVETEFGPKVRVHQPSCNADYTCLEGDCPSFLTVVPGKDAKPRRPPEPPGDLPEPEPVAFEGEFGVRIVGIGGGGVVTANQVLATASLLEGFHVSGLDQTGLSQKGGPVVSDLRICREPHPAAARAPAGSVDLYIGLDALGAARADNLVACHPARTGAVVSTGAVPTGQMVTGAEELSADLDVQLRSIEAATRRDASARCDAPLLAERLFGDDVPANVIVLGFACQRGLLPVSRAALREALGRGGVAAETNLAAFEWGRAQAARPEAVAAAIERSSDRRREPELTGQVRALLEVALGEAGGVAGELPADLRRSVAIRLEELIAYQGPAYARRYADTLARVRRAEMECLPASAELTGAVAEGLFKLMAYKDEYEVARLHLDAFERLRLEEELGEGAKVWLNLQPPLLRSLGLRRKLRFGRWLVPALRALRAMRRLRGTPFDPFGHSRLRRMERRLVSEYEEIVAAALSRLAPETHSAAVELCALATDVRGYEQIKLDAVDRFRERSAALLDSLAAGDVEPGDRGDAPARSAEHPVSAIPIHHR